MTPAALRRCLLGALLATLAAPGALALGLACQQDCTSGTCLQAECAVPAAGAGFCVCASGALPLGGGTYAAYCRAWGQPQPGCSQALPPGSAATLPAPQLPNAGTMTQALAGQNPFVAMLVSAMQDGNGNWANAPVSGLVHDVLHDPATGALSQGTAVPFTAAAAPGSGGQGGGVQIDVAVQGDLGQLAWLSQYCSAAAPSAIPPTSIHGVVTAGGLHGSLSVLGPAGRSQTVQW
jgi:hypothetical protein